MHENKIEPYDFKFQNFLNDLLDNFDNNLINSFYEENRNFYKMKINSKIKTEKKSFFYVSRLDFSCFKSNLRDFLKKDFLKN